MTNYERLKNMSIEEMAKELGTFCPANDCWYCKFSRNTGNALCDDGEEVCSVIVKKWLESEVDK